ncbi:ATPase family AAA domain-containing protein 2-like isoform X2 [Osmerus mordax]|uniref:ATPase family AAA domain-containing protein 2-like isoform X2 n=1 Tax=Osmerus mordax TaxID=8014 RepID=UPI00351077D5
MVMLRSSSGGAEPATPKNPDLDISSEFLSLVPASQRKSTRLKRGLDDSCSSPENNTQNGHLVVKEENGRTRGSLQTRGQRVKHEVSFAEMNGKIPQHPQAESKTSEHSTRRSPRLQGDGKASSDKQADEVDEESTPKRTHFGLRSRDQDSAARRSSSITRSKRNSRNQSVLYDRLITNTAEAVLQKMDDMQKMRRRLRSRDTQEELGMYTRAKRKRFSERTDEENENTQKKENGATDYSEDEVVEEDEEGNNEADDDDDNEDDGEDEEGDNQKRYDFRQRKAVVRYQAPQDEPRKQPMYFKGHSSPARTRRRFRFSTAGPRSPYNRRRSSRRRHAIHSSDSTSSSSSSSSSDEEKFHRRRSKNRNRPINRCLPMNLVKEDLLGIHKDRMKIGSSLADVDPMQIDQTVRFDSIGGLTTHISALKEMVVFPLLYPEVFERFKIQPPRGCLFYGPPGTGKTLVARALSNECSQGDKKVSFFMRKGADCLSKWVGESERQLRLLFDQAYQMRPAIIFFDEIDGLAPVRSSRQDQIHSSIVSTLLALMDGLDSRGEVVVIGATNRLDSIDPALRRPGRFDREFLFGLPDREARKDILKIHTRQWDPQPSDAFMEELADKCVGYCGADIKAVCGEAALCALRRRYPQIYSSSQKLLLDVSTICIGSRDFLSAMRRTVPASQRAVASPVKALTPVVQPLMGAALKNVLEVLGKLFPHVEQGLKRKKDSGVPGGVFEDDLMFSEDEDSIVSPKDLHHPLPRPAREFLSFHRSVLSQPTSYRPRLLLSGRPGSGQSAHLAPAVLHALEKFSVYTLDVAVLLGVSSTSPEEACAQIFCEAKRTSPSILYMPHIQQWWVTMGAALRATFLSLLSTIPSFSPVLLLATCSLPHADLAYEIQDLFRMEYGEVYHIQPPTQKERRNFFEDLILNQAAKAPMSKRKAALQALEVLPVAPAPPPRQLTEKEQQRLEEQEEDTLRELRLFLRDVTNRLSLDKRFKAFTKPVDLGEVPDYATVIKQPMDLSTIISRIDLHKYGTAKEFLHEVDLIWQNALEYNPDRDPSDRQIRQRACALKDTVHAIIRDELDEDFEKICEDIKESRSTRGCSKSRFAPSYYHVLPRQPQAVEPPTTEAAPPREPQASPAVASTPRHPAYRRKRRKGRWCNGYLTRKKASPHASKDDSNLPDSGEDEEEEEEEEADGKGMESEEEPVAVVSEQDTEGVDTEHAQTEQESQPMEEEEAGEMATREPAERDEANSHAPGEGGDGNSQAAVEGGEQTSQATLEGGERNSQASTKGGDQRSCSPSEAGDQKFHGPVEGGDQSSQSPSDKGDQGQKSTTQITEPETLKPAVEEEASTEKGTRRMTRGLKSQVLQQQMIDVDKALEILDQKIPPFVVDRDKLKELLLRVVSKTEGYEVYQLEKLYALLSQSIYRHRRDYDKTSLLQEMEKEIEDFC